MKINRGDTVSAEVVDSYGRELQDAIRRGDLFSFTPSVHFDGAIEFEIKQFSASDLGHRVRFEKINEHQFYCSHAT